MNGSGRFLNQQISIILSYQHSEFHVKLVSEIIPYIHIYLQIQHCIYGDLLNLTFLTEKIIFYHIRL